MSPVRRYLFWILLSSTVINLLALATPLVMLQVFDRVIAKGSLQTLTLIMLGATIAIGAESLLRVARSQLSSWIAAHFEHQAMMGVATRLLAMPLHDFERTGTGAYQAHFRAAQVLKSHYSGQTFQQILDLPFTGLYIGIVALINPWIGLLLLGGYLFFALLVWALGFKHRQRVLDRTQIDLRRTNFLVETLANIHTLKAMSMEAIMLRRYERLQEASARAMARLAFALDIAAGIGALFSPLITMLTVALGAYFVVQGQLTTGELAACTLLGFRSLAPIQRLGGIWASYQRERVMREDLAHLMAQPALPASEPVDAIPPASSASISLRNVSYRFPGARHNLLTDVSLDIQAGECLLIRGGNGSGKTTLLQLMCGLLQPTEGQVTIGQQSVQDMDPDARLKLVAYLPQRPQMFQGTLLDNVTVFDPSRLDIALDTAAALQVDGLVSRLPRGWDSVVGDAANEAMPPGFRQRIAVVRALSTHPDIILFDDATASMDSRGDSLILDFLQANKGRRTIVLVSQRPSFQKMADRVVTLDAGKLVAGLGTPAGAEAALAAAKAAAVDSHAPAPSRPHLQATRWERAHATMYSHIRQPGDLALCMPVLLRALGWRLTSRDLAESLPYFIDTLDLTGFENAMARLGFRAVAGPNSLRHIDTRAMPCLFIPDQGAAFVVVGKRGSNLLVAGSILETPRELSALDSRGTAYFFQKIDATTPATPSWVAGTVKRFRPLIVQAGLASIASGLIMITSSMFLMAVYNEVIPTAALDTLAYLAAGVLLALLVGSIFIIHRAKLLAYLAGRTEYLFGSTVLQQILSMSPSLTERASVGAQLARISTFEAIRDLFVGPIASTLLESPAVIVVLVTLGIVNPVSLLVILLVALIYFGLYWLFEPLTSRRVSQYGRASTRRAEFIIEMIGKMRTIRECGAAHIWLQRFREVSSEATSAAFETEKISTLLVNLSYGVMMLAGLAIVAISVPLTLNHTVGPGALIASMLLMWRVLGPMQTVFTNLSRIETVRSAARQLEAIMQIKGERLQTAASPVARGLKGKVAFSRVSFRYSAIADPAVVGATFTVRPGEIVAITGPNGGGKSTLIKLLLGMYLPQAGAIQIDDVDIRQLDPCELRRLFGYAPQDSQLFRATIVQNLRLAAPDATDAEIREALEMAGAWDQVLALPKGLEYRIADNASDQLPATLKQKLTLARAYLTHAPIMIFDEPGAALDPLGDMKFMKMLDHLRGNTTVFFITHRPSHMRLADTVMVFDQGYLRAAGTPDQILNPPPAAA